MGIMDKLRYIKSVYMGNYYIGKEEGLRLKKKHKEMLKEKLKRKEKK